MDNLCIHMAIHERDGKDCFEHQPIEVSKVDVQEATDQDGIIKLTLVAYFLRPDDDGKVG